MCVFLGFFFLALGGQCCRRFWARGKSLVLCGLLSPCKTLRNFLLPPTAEYGNPAVSGHFCKYSHNSRGSFFYTTPFCFETLFAFENDSFVVECPTEPSSLLSLLSFCCPAVLQLKLQQRRTREELVSQGIMPRKYHSVSAFDWVAFRTKSGVPSMPRKASTRIKGQQVSSFTLLAFVFPSSGPLSHCPNWLSSVKQTALHLTVPSLAFDFHL